MLILQDGLPDPKKFSGSENNGLPIEKAISGGDNSTCNWSGLIL